MAGTVTYDGGNASSVPTSTVDGGSSGTFFPIEGPTLTAQPTSSPPSVEIVVDDVDPATNVVTIYRIADGRTTPVRGGIRKYAVGGTSLVDSEAPFGVPVSYRVEMFSDPNATPDSSLGFTAATETFLDVRVTWLHQPLTPSLCVRALRLMGTAADQVRVTPGDLVYPQGAELATWVGGQRRGLSGSDWDLLVESQADADRMQAVFGAYGSSQTPVICVRTPPPMRVPRTLFLAVSELHEVDVDIPSGGDAVRFTFTGTEARPPAPGLVVSALRRMDLDAAYATRGERTAAYLTRLARDSDFSLAGVADGA